MDVDLLLNQGLNHMELHGFRFHAAHMRLCTLHTHARAHAHAALHVCVISYNEQPEDISWFLCGAAGLKAAFLRLQRCAVWADVSRMCADAAPSDSVSSTFTALCVGRRQLLCGSRLLPVWTRCCSVQTRRFFPVFWNNAAQMHALEKTN